MKKLFFVILLGGIFATGCGEVLPNKPEPSPPHVSCSDLPEQAALENAEASQAEIELACLVKNHPEQNRVTMSYHPILGAVARARAADIALNGTIASHVDVHGYGPDWYVCEAGYALWDEAFCELVFLEPHTNTIESLAMGGPGSNEASPSAIFAAFLRSPGHKAHLLGEGFFSVGTYYGIGHTHIESHGNAWIFIAAALPADE